MSPRLVLTSVVLVGAASLSNHRRAAADPLRWHLEAGGAHAVGNPQGREFGPGGEGRIAGEIALGRAAGLQLEGGSLWLARTHAPMDPSIADHGNGAALFAMGGIRVRPLTEVAGPWVDMNVGYVRTGTLDRLGFDAHLGYDWRVGDGRWDVGPYVGYFQIVQGGDLLRPEDAHVLAIGIHVALGAERPGSGGVVASTPSALPDPPPSSPLPPPDRDADGVADPQDACPDEPGVPSADPALNGCPPLSDTVRVVDDRIEYGEVILFETDRVEVHPDAWPTLRKLAEFMSGNLQIEGVEIIGHADERGPADYNVRLSQARADAVRKSLVGFGVDGARLTAKGLGDRHPRATGHTEDDWRQNRRVEFRISKLRGARETSTRPAVGAPGAPGGQR